jgi:hypothetical protein
MRYTAFSALSALVALTAAAFFSCDSNNTPAGGSTDGSQWIDDFAATLCDLTESCCALHEYPVPNDCLNQAKKQLQGDLGRDIIEKGLKFDPVAGEQCIAAFRGLAPSCPNSFTFPICKSVFTGPDDDTGTGCDAACIASDAGHAICHTDSSTAADGAVDRSQSCQIEITVAPGGACDVYGRLPVERHCDPKKNSNCVQGVCSTAKPIGAVCTTPNSTECVPEATCTAGFCVARIPLGGACNGFECVEGAYCDTGATGTCRPTSRWKKYCFGDYN